MLGSVSSPQLLSVPVTTVPTQLFTFTCCFQILSECLGLSLIQTDHREGKDWASFIFVSQSPHTLPGMKQGSVKYLLSE